MKEKFSLFNLFGRKSITKDDEFAEIPTNFKGFFVMFGRKFWNLSNLSLIYSLFNIPFLFIFLAFALQEQHSVVGSPMHAAFYGFYHVSDSVILKSIFPIVSNYLVDSVPSTASYVMLGISALCLFTFGLSNAGAAYIIRGYNRGDPIFIFSDFFSTIKRNWKQALVVGFVDEILIAVLIYDFLFWNQGGFFNGILQYFALFLCVLYFFMRLYIYTILITFDLSIYKIFKDAFLLSFLGLKRNLLALFGILIVVAANMYLCILYIPVGVMLPIILTIGVVMFISGYASYPVIKKYMIDPYYNENPDELSDDDSSDDDDVVFEDRG